MSDSQKPLLEIDHLAVSFPIQDARGLSTGRARAVRDVSLSVYPGQTLAVVGESGCGKSVSAISSLQLLPPSANVESGQIKWWGGFDNKPGDLTDEPVDLLTLNNKDIRKIRGNQIAMIFQEPMTSLNPVYTIGRQMVEAIILHQNVKGQAARDIAAKALADVGIAEPVSRLKAYPHQLSGGMRQRVMIAMALACKPSLLLADEPTTALDVTIQAQILELLRKLQRDTGMAMLLITHDLGVVAENADTVAVMYAGRVVEYGKVEDVFHNPLHPYTRGLLASMPVLGRFNVESSHLPVIEGQVPTIASKELVYAVNQDGTQSETQVLTDPSLADVIWIDEADGAGKVGARRIFRSDASEIPALTAIKQDHWAAVKSDSASASVGGGGGSPKIAYKR